MCTSIRFNLVFVVAILSGSFQANSQNLFDSLHTAEYANFLFLSGNYKLASEEYERLLFLSSPNDNQKLNLIKSYRLAGEPAYAIRRMNNLWEEPESISAEVAGEYIALQIIAGNYHYAYEQAASSQVLNSKQKLFFQSSALILSENYPEALGRMQSGIYDSNPAITQYMTLCAEALSSKVKNPAVSGVMSAVIPGSGKFYTGEWQDGITSLLLIGSTAWQSYRGFKRNGTSSAYGWIMGTVSLGFYAANIYGSVKSANKYNVTRRNNINIRVQAVFYNNIP